ncbi:MAG: ADP-ribose pyrophosphatase [Elusimicrobia bacterium]|nr:MAG: ADP-ribose pyrophosphatase [Elusimicrobiota bacterium]
MSLWGSGLFGYNPGVPRSKSFLEKCIRQRVIHKGRAINFHVDQVRLPDGKTAVREYVDHPGAVTIIPFVNAKTVVLVRQYRYAIGKITYELPAGKLSPREKPLVCARRELREETGYSARRMRRLLTFWPAPAFSNESMFIYRAEGLSPGALDPDDDEFIDAVKIPFYKALDWVASGRIKDAKTIIGLLACAVRRT